MFAEAFSELAIGACVAHLARWMLLWFLFLLRFLLCELRLAGIARRLGAKLSKRRDARIDVWQNRARR